jgi:hypothetical protein
VAGAWRAVLSDALPFSFTDEPLRYGTRFYKVAIIEADGTERPGSGLLMAAPEPLATDTTRGLSPNRQHQRGRDRTLGPER